MSDFKTYSAEQERQLLLKWLKPLGLWSTIVEHGSIAPLLTNDADRAELETLKTAKRRCEDDFAGIWTDQNPPPEAEEEHRQILKCHDDAIDAAKMKRRNSSCVNSSLTDVDCMFAAIRLMFLNVEQPGTTISLTELAREMAGHTKENPPITKAEKRNVDKIRLRILKHLLRVSENFDLFDIEIINMDDKDRIEYRICVSDRLETIFQTHFYPKLDEM